MNATRSEACDEGLRIPMAKGHMVNQALSDRGPAGGLDEVGLERPLAGKSIPRIDSFSRLDVNKHKPFQHVGHVRLAILNPDPAPFGHVGPQLLAGQQSFFYG